VFTLFKKFFKTKSKPTPPSESILTPEDLLGIPRRYIGISPGFGHNPKPSPEPEPLRPKPEDKDRR
jgi:hypothetical protein